MDPTSPPRAIVFSFNNKGRVIQYNDFGNILGLETEPPDLATLMNWSGPYEPVSAKSITYKPRNLPLVTDVYEISPTCFTAVAKIGSPPDLVERGRLYTFSINGVGQYEHVNDAFLSTFGLAHAQVIGRTNEELFTLAPSPGNFEFGPVTTQDCYILRNGTNVSTCTVRIPKTDKTAGHEGIGILIDVSSPHAEKTFDQSPHTTSIVRNQFLANMSHEIRTPIHTIIQLVTLAKDSELTPQQAETLEGIQKSCGQLMSTVNDILDFSRLQEGVIKLEFVDVDVVALVDDLASLHSWSSRRKGLEFHLETNLDTKDLWIYTDYGRLRQILNNLLNNAVKFTFKGTVGFKVSKESTKNGMFVKFDVYDTGIGIREEKRLQLFQPFTQADASFTRRFGGTGLGLSTAFSMAKLLGAHLDLESKEGSGSTFTLRLPYRKGKPKPSLSPTGDVHFSAEIDRARQDHLVLVVEDNSMNQKVVLKNLEKLGFKAVGADNGLEAIQQLQATPTRFAMIFMDCSMPVMDGYTATQEIRKLPAPICNIPIVAMTANVLQGEREHCLEVGMDNYLEKPAQRESMLEMIKRYYRAPAV